MLSTSLNKKDSSKICVSLTIKTPERDLVSLMLLLT